MGCKVSNLEGEITHMKPLRNIYLTSEIVHPTKGRHWMILILFMKDETKDNIPSNYRPIACVPTLRKIFTGIIGNKIYYHLDKQQLLPSKQKGYRCRSKQRKDDLKVIVGD